jgi:plastocyanin
VTRRLVAALFLLLAAWSAPAYAATATVTIDTTLHPKSLSVAPGTTVTWRNADSARHRVRTVSGPAELDSGDLDPGQAWSFTFRATGTYSYVDHRNEDDSAYWGSVTVSSSSSSSPAPPQSGTVHLAGRTFTPSSLRVAAGGAVTFVNDDGRSHTVTSDSGAFDSGVLAAGSSWVRRFPSAGTYRYHCAIHPDMTGTVVVPTATGAVPPPAPAAPPAPAPAAPPPAPAPPTAPGAARVSVVDFAFAPAGLAVHVGDSVTWTNAGRSPHTVSAADGSFGTSLLSPGASYRTVARRTGTVAYVCRFHPQMTATLVVLPKAAALPAPADVAAAPAPPAAATAPRPSGAASATTGPGPAATTPGPAGPRTRAVAATTMWDSPLARWTVWSTFGLVAFLGLAWWRGRERGAGVRRG